MESASAQDMEALYRAAVGPKKADFYVPKFVRFDQPAASSSLGIGRHFRGMV